MTEQASPTTRPWRPGDTPPEVRALIEREQAELDALWAKREREGVEPAERPRRGMKPSMLARNLLRHGLSDASSFDMSDLVDELAVLLDRMRIVAP